MMSCSTYTIVFFCGQIRLTSPELSGDRRFPVLINPALACGIVVNLKVYLSALPAQIGARARKRVKIFLQKAH
jgi:hypothetical protein